MSDPIIIRCLLDELVADRVVLFTLSRDFETAYGELVLRHNVEQSVRLIMDAHMQRPKLGLQELAAKVSRNGRGGHVHTDWVLGHLDGMVAAFDKDLEVSAANMIYRAAAHHRMRRVPPRGEEGDPMCAPGIVAPRRDWSVDFDVRAPGDPDGALEWRYTPEAQIWLDWVADQMERAGRVWCDSDGRWSAVKASPIVLALRVSVDGEPAGSLGELIHANAETLTDDMVDELAQSRPGDRLLCDIGGGAVELVFSASRPMSLLWAGQLPIVVWYARRGRVVWATFDPTSVGEGGGWSRVERPDVDGAVFTMMRGLASMASMGGDHSDRFYAMSRLSWIERGSPDSWLCREPKVLTEREGGAGAEIIMWRYATPADPPADEWNPVRPPLALPHLDVEPTGPYRCCAPGCPGRPWRASDAPHRGCSR